MWNKRLFLETVFVFVFAGGLVYGITGEPKTILIVACVCLCVYFYTLVTLKAQDHR